MAAADIILPNLPLVKEETNNHTVIFNKQLTSLEDIHSIVSLVERKLKLNLELTLILLEREADSPVKYEEQEEEETKEVPKIEPEDYIEEMFEMDEEPEPDPEPDPDYKDKETRKKGGRKTKDENPISSDDGAEKKPRKRRRVEKPGVRLCPDCGKTFNSRGALSAHRRNTHIKEEKTYTCPICSQHITTFRYATYFRHKQDCEAKLPEFAERYVCPVCGQKFGTQYLFQPHYERCSGKLELRMLQGKIKGTEYRCDYENCTYKSNMKLRLKNHVNAVHLNIPKIRDFTCDTCGRAFTESKGLENHRKTVHQNIRNHQCNECGNGFKTKEMLRRHMKIHSDICTHICPFCSKGFKQSATLYRHKLSCPFNPEKNKIKVTK